MIVHATADSILKAFFGQQNNVTLAPSCYIGLSTTTPNNNGSNFTEPSANAGYSRTLLGSYNSAQSFIMGASVNGVITNDSIIFFPEAEEGWGTVTHFGLFSAKTGGTPIFWGALTAGVAVPTGYIPIFRVEALSVTLT